MRHECVKCKAPYQDQDPEPYLCASCLEEKKAIAAQIDAQFASRPRVTPKSDLQMFDETGKTMNVDGRMVTFNKA